MVFDNSEVVRKPFWQRVHANLPIVGVVVSIVAVAIGMHTALRGLAVLGVAHLVLVFAVVGVARHRRRS